MNKFLLLIITLVIVFKSTSAQHTNIMISDQSWPEEPSIVIDPNNTDIVVAGANLDNYYYSSNGGMTWSVNEMQSSFGVWGDPCIIVDTNGHFYFFHLSNATNWIDRIVCQKSTDNGQTWSDGSYMGLNGTKAQDKEWAIVDRNTNNIYVSWTQFDDYGSTLSGDSSYIMFSKSIDGGQTWSQALRINNISGNCIDSDSTVEGAVPAVGPNGEVYVAWSGPEGIRFDRSVDGGNTWLDNDIFVDSQPGGWDYNIPGISRCNGLPVTLCDLSGGPNHGTIYINWSDQRNDTTDTDIWLTKSSDGGNTWSQAIRVNDDTSGKHQFFTWMAMDQTNGNLHFVFYDRRNDITDTNLTDVYMASSPDGGNSFINFKISDSSFIPDENIFFGDYTNIVAHNDVIRPIWARLNNGLLSVWTALIDPTFLGIDNVKKADIKLEQNYPNPVEDITYFAFKLHEPSVISLRVYDLNGKEIAVLINKEKRNTGKYVESFNPRSHHLKSGIYSFVLTNNNISIMKKMVVVK